MWVALNYLNVMTLSIRQSFTATPFRTLSSSWAFLKGAVSFLCTTH